MLYKEYDPKVLKKLQKVELGILKDFHEFCISHDIEYFICGGTMLGAVRHGGFIPWDDDLDVGMTRPHYERFLKLAGEAEKEGDYALLNYHTQPAFPVMITKWYKKGTLFCDEDAVTCGYESGIAVDIFCFDQVADEEKALRRQAMQTWIFGKLLILCQISHPTIYAEGYKAKLAGAVATMANRILKILHLPASLFYDLADAGARKYEGRATERVAFLYDPTPYTSMIPVDSIYPTREISFEGITVKCPAKPEVYLRKRYGASYRELPPVEKRHNHPPMKLDFGSEEWDS